MLTWNKVLDYAKNGSPKPENRVEKTEAQWREQLSEEEFRVTRKAGTERPFTGEHCNSYDEGIYACVCCGTELFNSEIKYNSHSGWPSFTEPVKYNVIQYNLDTSHGMQRVETCCAVCDAHLGHVFPDGPKPTGLRFCINSASLKMTK
ncbi:MAG: peptide-methionine (R)-S-oxide reductase MsrB [Luteibaculum sp.]